VWPSLRLRHQAIGGSTSFAAEPATAESPFFLSVGYSREAVVARIRSGWTDHAIRFDLRAGGVDAPTLCALVRTIWRITRKNCLTSWRAWWRT